MLHKGSLISNDSDITELVGFPLYKPKQPSSSLYLYQLIGVCVVGGVLRGLKKML